MSIGAIVPTLVGVNSDPSSSVFTQDPEYDYRGYLYCDGAEYNIKDYPTLYESVGNEYIRSTDFNVNSITFAYYGPPGTIHRSFVHGGSFFIEVYGQWNISEGAYDRVIPNNASIQFVSLASMPTGGILSEDGVYLLNYTEAQQILAEENDTHVYRVLLTDIIGGGGTPADPDESEGGTVTWQISSSNLINDGGDYLVLPSAHAGTVPEVDPNTYDPITGTGYPTGYISYNGARNDTLALDWSQLVGLPSGSSIDSYEILLEDISTNGTNDNPNTGEVETTFILWWVKDIPKTTTSINVNGIWPSSVSFGSTEVQKSSVGTSPDWINNGYQGPQPPLGEKHIYRIYVKAYLLDGQSLVQSLDFTFGDGPLIPIGIVKEPYYDVNVDVEGGDSGLDPVTDPTLNDLNIYFTAFSPQTGSVPATGHPTVRIRKPYILSDYPYILGKFRVPDYRDRKLIGFGEGVEGSGTPLVEDRISMNLGDVGGRWYISTDTINTPAEFFEISDVITTGYGSVTTQIEPYLIGEKKYTVGPIQDYFFNKAPTHDHQILHSQPDEQTDAPISGVDTYTSNYVRYKGAVEQFTPGGAQGSGEPKAHSHGMLGSRPSNARISTYGNTDGIGESVEAGNGCVNYRITEAPAIDLVSVNGDGSFIYATTASDHGFSPGDAVLIFDTGNGAVEGSFEVLSDGLGSTSFKAVSTFSGSVAGGKVREAAGFFEPQTYTPEPRVYVVDDLTTIGGKVIPGVNVGIGEVRYDNIYSTGTHSIPALARTSSFEFFIYAGGGGGKRGSAE